MLMIALSFFFFASSAFAGAGEGKKAFDAAGCAACHQIKGPAKEKTIKDALAKKGPELWYAGSKFKKEFLGGWLEDPRPIRPMEFYSLTKTNQGNHPKLSGKDAADVAGFLMGLKAPEVKDSGIKPQENQRGRIIFVKKQSCYGCHQVKEKGVITGGLTGPSLAGAAERLSPDWVCAYLSNPRVFKPVKDMPDYAGILTDEEIRDLAAYVSNLN
ncbi:MAG: c-type cytochrome [Deltaproteobacteria bacterium]|nr:c-type cytochrome [Deltaproteobacteria bacterium]